MTTDNTLSEKIKVLADEVWEGDQKPLFLSNLPFRLKEKYPDFDYKSVLGGGSLKEFILKTGGSCGYKLIEHPDQWAKIAVAPDDVVYQFPQTSEHLDCGPKNNESAGEKKVITLLKTLGKLPKEDLDKINIPISVLVNMVK